MGTWRRLWASWTSQLQQAVDPDATNHDGMSALHEATARGHVEVACCLLEAGADKDQAANDGDTPMHFAARSGNLSIVRTLLVGSPCSRGQD